MFENFNSADLINEVNALEQSTSQNFEDVPHGKYEVSIAKMELKATKEKGYPMLSVQFKVLEGQHKGGRIFMNQVLSKGDQNDKWRIHRANQFMRSLKTNVIVNFNGFADYENVINAVFAEASERFEYALEYGEDKKGFESYTITDVFALE